MYSFIVVFTLPIFLIACLFMRPCSSQFVPGYQCNDTYLMENVYECEKSLVKALKNKPLSQCKFEVYRLQQCTGRFIYSTCYKTLYAIYPKYRHGISLMMRLTMKQFNNALFYCHDNDDRIDWTSIPHTVKRLWPCDIKFFHLSKNCSKTFYSVYKSSRTDRVLCSLYEEAKLCRARLSYLHCKAALPVNKQNPFCKTGFDQSKMFEKELTCMVDVCTTSPSKLIATPPCHKPRNVTCSTPPGSPFQFNSCMKIRLTAEPFPGITVVEERRNCSSLALCQSKLYCKNANRTGLLKTCQTQCCHGNLCNKKTSEITSSLQETWTKVNHSWITGQQSYGVQFKYITTNSKNFAINVNVTSNSCQGNPWLGLTTFLRGNWSKVKYTQEFHGNTSCWQIFGHSSQTGNYTQDGRSAGLEEFSRRLGDQIYDELRMGGDNDTFQDFTSMCGNETGNFWHAQYGHGLRRATVVLRRNPLARHAGIGTATSCGLPSYTIKDIYVYHC